MTRPDFDVAEFLAWCRTKPADERYDYTDSLNCAVSQFGRATDRPQLVDLYSWELEATAKWLADAVHTGGPSEDYTFGALVKRLEAIVTPSVWLSPDAYRDVGVGELA